MRGRQRKGFQWSRLPNNYFCYRLTYYAASPQTNPAAKASLGQLVKKGDIIAMAQEAGSPVSQPAPFSGTVVELSEVCLKQGDTLVGDLKLLMLERCDHQPKSEESNICEFCQQQVWAYEEKHEREYRRSHFSQSQNRSGEVLWKISVNQHFGKGEKLGTIGEQDIELNFRGRVTYTGTEQDENAVILKARKTICRHEKVFESICCHCSEWVEQQTTAVAQSSGVKLSGRMLDKAQEEIMDHLMENRKIMLVLDLDNTILHCLEAKVDEPAVPRNLTDFFEITYMDTLLVVKMRKYLREFLAAVLPLYEIFIYTKGTRTYSERICQHIRETYTELFEGGKNPNAFIQNKIVSRDEDSDLEKKNIDMILKKSGYVVIMDDRREVWGRPANAIFVKYFKYFDRLPNGSIATPRVDDFYLYFAKSYLVQLHGRFYNEADNKKKNGSAAQHPDFGTIVRQHRKDMLKSYRAIFLLSGDLKKNYHFRRAVEFGISPAPEGEANIVIYETNCLFKDSKRYENVLELPMVHQLWLEYCYVYNFKFDIDMFRHKEGQDLGQMTPEQRELFDEALFANHSEQQPEQPVNVQEKTEQPVNPSTVLQCVANPAEGKPDAG